MSVAKLVRTVMGLAATPIGISRHELNHSRLLCRTVYYNELEVFPHLAAREI